MNLKTLSWAAWALLMLGVGYLLWIHLHRPDPAPEVSRLQHQLHQDSLTTKQLAKAYGVTQQRLDSSLTRTDSVITRWKTVVTQGPRITDTIPGQPIPHGPDSALIAAGNDMARECAQLRSSCQAFRDTAEVRIDQLNLRYAHLDSLYHLPPAKQRRWGLGLFLGYGGTFQRETRMTDETRVTTRVLSTGPTVGVGVVVKLF